MCECLNPFCDEDHAPFVPTDIENLEAPDDWVSPQAPEYSERDDEAFNEMVWQDAAGLS